MLCLQWHISLIGLFRQLHSCHARDSVGPYGSLEGTDCKWLDHSSIVQVFDFFDPSIIVSVVYRSPVEL